MIYIEANSGAVKRVGRCDAYATEFDLEAEEYVPLPKVRGHGNSTSLVGAQHSERIGVLVFRWWGELQEWQSMMVATACMRPMSGAGRRGQTDARLQQQCPTAEVGR